ncbi:uncharacterized protein LOC142330931 [Lycorma delicatula]|uniref:uncharacterized protein LOC142330931 n=1 Tax=Lycorma delicatula TaxID=130591 RepID=UPI003F514712
MTDSSKVLFKVTAATLLQLLLLPFLLVLLSSSSAESSPIHTDVRESKLEDVWRPLPSLRNIRPVYQPDPPLSRESKNQEVKNDTSNAVSTSDKSPGSLVITGSARGGHTTVTPIGESLKMVTKQLLQSPSATDMIITDVRTPPKIKSQIKSQMNEEFVSLGKGEAIPITLDEHDAYEMVSNTQHTITKNPSATTPTTTNGISTWILLSNSDSTTQSASQKKTQKPTAPSPQQGTNSNNNNSGNKKKLQKPNTESNSGNLAPTVVQTTKSSIDVTSKPEKKPSVSSNKPNTNITKNISSNNHNKDDIKTPITINLQDSKFKNRQPIIMGRVPTTSTTVTKNKTVDVWIGSNKKVSTITPPQPTSEIKIETNTIAAIVPTRRRPSPQTTVMTTTISPPVSYASSTLPTPIFTKKSPVLHAVVPTTSVIIETESADPDDADEATTEDLVQTTKRPRRPSHKKKKKPSSSSNKNRRRHPATSSNNPQDNSVLESKITEEINSTKTAVSSPSISSSQGSRPLSTRIYNYLAREVMPSVGVGVVGLLLTAGLAGLFLYPFGGGVAARRTSYENTKNSIPSPDGHMYYYNEYSSKSDLDNGQAEESVFGQVLSGMSQAEAQYESRPSSYSTNSNSNNKNNHHDNSNNNNNNNINDNLTNNNKYRYDGTSGHSTSNTASIVYPSSKDSQKFSQPILNSNDQISNPSGLQDSATGYSTLTDLSSSGGSHNDRNYPSLTTDTIMTDSQYSNSQYSPVVASSSGSGYSSSSSNKNSGTGLYGNVGSSNGSPQYSSLIGSSSMNSQNSNGASYSSLVGASSASNPQNINGNSQYSSMIGSGSSTSNNPNPNMNPSYSGIISSPSVSISGSNGSPQYQNLIGSDSVTSGQSSTGITGTQYSSMIGSSSMNTQYSSPMQIENSGNNHYSKSSLSSSNTNIHQFSPTQLNEHNSGSQYSTLTGISVDNNDNSKYPVLKSPSHHQNKYQSSGEYASYNNPSEVGTQGVINYNSGGSPSMVENHRTSEQDMASPLSPSSSSHPSPLSSSSGSSNNWKEMDYAIVNKDMIKEEDKSDKSQPQFAALHSSQYMSSLPSRTDQSSFPNNVDMISITGGSNYNGASLSSSASLTQSSSSSSSTTGNERHRPLTSIEHGPRYYKITKRRKRQVASIPPTPTSSSSSSSSSSSYNEIDGELPKEDPAEILSSSTKYPVTIPEILLKLSTENISLSDSSETTTEVITTTLSDTTVFETNENSTNVNNNDNNNNTETHENIEESLKDNEPVSTQRPPNDEFTFLGFVRRLAQFKLKLGLSFLRSTSQAVSKYLQSVQQRMEKVVRRLEKRTRSNDRQTNIKENNKTNRFKRDVTKYYERKQKHKKLYKKKST